MYIQHSHQCQVEQNQDPPTRVISLKALCITVSESPQSQSVDLDILYPGKKLLLTPLEDFTVNSSWIPSSFIAMEGRVQLTTLYHSFIPTCCNAGSSWIFFQQFLWNRGNSLKFPEIPPLLLSSQQPFELGTAEGAILN